MKSQTEYCQPNAMYCRLTVAERQSRENVFVVVVKSAYCSRWSIVSNYSWYAVQPPKPSHGAETETPCTCTSVTSLMNL
jgi:hypothetical protein